MASRLLVEKLERVTADGVVEALAFVPGVNVIVGAQNTGKSTWLRMLDYIMGGTGSPSARFDEGIVQKYRSISATFQANGESFTLERQWSEGGDRSSALLNGAPYNVADVQSLLLERLGIPILRYPQGNVYTSDRTWPTLGWRSIFRHVYRRQDCWGELVSQQPDSEQQACLLQFLGIAEYLFSDERAQLVDKQRSIANLQSRKDYFIEIMNQIAPDIVGDQGVSVGITLQSIEFALSRVSDEIGALVNQRVKLLSAIQEGVATSGNEVSRLLERRTTALSDRNRTKADLELVIARLDELRSYQTNLQQEINRLERADVAATIFENIRVTNCPACDQLVHDHPNTDGHCFLCGQLTPDCDGTSGAAVRRLKFERDQIVAELAEAGDLLTATDAEKKHLLVRMAEQDNTIRRLSDQLRPFQATASAIVPEELALVDQRIGSLNARIEALNRLRDPLETRDNLTIEIEKLRKEVTEHESNLAIKEREVEFEVASDRLEDGFNTYLNALRSRDPTSWTKVGPVAVRVSERKTQYLIGKRSASGQIGGTLTLFFLFAYQYALLSLSNYSDCHYPGLTILDLFPDITKGREFQDSMALVIDPFVELARRDDFGAIQIIVTSREFPEDESINRIALSHIWR